MTKKTRLERLENAPGVEPEKPWLTIRTMDEQNYFRCSPWLPNAEPIQAEELEEIHRTHQVIVIHYVNWEEHKGSRGEAKT